MELHPAGSVASRRVSPDWFTGLRDALAGDRRIHENPLQPRLRGRATYSALVLSALEKVGRKRQT